MKQTNEIEVIDGIKGEWRTVTKEEAIGKRTRVRDYEMIGWTEFYCDKQLTFDWKIIQAFFPLPASAKAAKAAKVDIIKDSFGLAVFLKIGTFDISINNDYKNELSAIRGARRFCKAIGYECVIQKEGK